VWLTFGHMNLFGVTHKGNVASGPKLEPFDVALSVSYMFSNDVPCGSSIYTC